MVEAGECLSVCLHAGKGIPKPSWGTNIVKVLPDCCLADVFLIICTLSCILSCLMPVVYTEETTACECLPRNGALSPWAPPM
eukprot:3719397-Pyramimonas_sp.AAC.1